MPRLPRSFATAAFRWAVLLVSAFVVTASGSQRPPWPPEVQPVTRESPPLSPAAALRTFRLSPGFRLELVASEPLVQDPVSIDWDPDGRLWVVEMPGYMRTVTGAGELEPLGRVVVLVDRDGDGRMDTRSVFADGLVMARAIKVLERGVLVGEPPNAWLMRDTDGDLRMDTKELVSNQYGLLAADPQNNANGFYWALDNRMYTAGQTAIVLRMKNGAFEVTRSLARGQWGVTQDDAGRIYRNTNESALHVDLVPTPYFARNPNLLRTRGSYHRLADDNPDLNIVWPIRPNPGTNRAYQVGIDRADGSLARFTAVCAPLVYRGDRLPAELRGNVFVAEPAGNAVSRILLSDTGKALAARKAYEKGEFLASTDERFRPVYLSDAPDGTLYIVDMYRGILEHRLSMTEYLRDQILARRLEQPTGLGRIYRVMHDTARRDVSRLPSATSELVALLAHENGWRRDTAQRLIVERGDRSVVPALARLARTATDWRARLHALWTLDGLDAIDRDSITRALDDPQRDIRVSAIRIAERWLGDEDSPMQAVVLRRLDDRDWAVRQQLAASIGVLPDGRRETAALKVLERFAGDPVVVDAALSGLRGREANLLDALLRDRVSTPERDTAVTMVTATIVRSGQDAPTRQVLNWIGEESRAAWQRSALLRGLEVGLLGAAMPGTPLRPPAAIPGAPCPTCPGGRAGPGGAYAYPRPPAAQATAGAPLRLPHQPASLASLASGTGELAARASQVLARISWPGKPGEAAIVPLTPAEQKRFDEGQVVYTTLCQACHQADGRGQEKLAPPLVGSALTLARADVPARVLLQGKEGATGLMPPIGATLSDDQIASVLTYVRREWGQVGAPVEPDVVRTVRALTGGRSRPWTDTELMELAVAPRP